VRILFVSAEYPPDTAVGGIAQNVGAIAPALAARGHEVHVLSCYPDQERREVVDAGVHVHRRPRPRSTLLRRRSPSGAAASRIEAAVAARRFAASLGAFDVVNVPDWMGEGLLFSLTPGAPVVSYLHTPLHLIAAHRGDDRGGGVADRIERLAVARSTIVTSTSRQLIEDLEADGWLRHPDTRVIPPPVDAAYFDGLPPADVTGPVLVAVGRCERRKAPEVLVDAAGLLAGDVPDLEVVFVGRSEGTRDGMRYADWVAARAATRGVRCRLVEHVERDAVRSWYGRARAVVVPSRYESFSMVAVEGMAAARPVVCTERVGAREVLGEAGDVIVPVDDAAALAAALRPLLADAAAARALGSRMREIVERRCSPERAAADREAAFADAVDLVAGRRRIRRRDGRRPGRA
jgi:glycosyltransferase involved in cell wall biosynthesis